LGSTTKDDAVSLRRADEGERLAEIARSGLDDGVARTQPAARLGLLDHEMRGPVLDTATRIGRLNLDQHLRTIVHGKVLQSDYRRSADQP
jgi:hypothetical protein